MTFGQGLKKARKELGLRASHIAKEINAVPNRITGYEHDINTPNLYAALDIANILGCSIYEMLEEKDIGIDHERERLAVMVEQLLLEGEMPKKIVDAVRRGSR